MKLLRESVATLEDAESLTFAIRVRKRLAYALLRSGHPFQAWKELSTAHEMAARNQVYDQITPTMELAHWLAERLGMTRAKEP